MQKVAPDVVPAPHILLPRVTEAHQHPLHVLYCSKKLAYMYRADTMVCMQEESRENFFIELLKFALIAVVIVVPVRLYVAQPFIVSGASMEPTFDNGQYLIVDELSYRIEDPKRGDVIIFHPPGQTNGTYFIKRVIGLPGETVHITDSTVSITAIDGTKAKLDESYIKNIGNGKTMRVALGQDEYFVMGDNRPESSDSRYWGVLPRGNIIGRALLRLLPLQSISILPGSTSFK